VGATAHGKRGARHQALCGSHATAFPEAENDRHLRATLQRIDLLDRNALQEFDLLGSAEVLLQLTDVLQCAPAVWLADADDPQVRR
jgi:hypothetical protein